MAPEAVPDPIAVALRASRLFESLNVQYVVAGSLASSLHGEPRSTNDIDIVADLRATHLAALAKALDEQWVWSEAAARDAVAAGGSFNLIHGPTAVKVDIFVVGDDAFDRHRVESGSRTLIVDGQDPGTGELMMDTPEHTVVRKLEWYRRGGGVSDRQWRDVVNVLRVQGAAIDDAELDHWATRLGVVDLLEAARCEAIA